MTRAGTGDGTGERVVDVTGRVGYQLKRAQQALRAAMDAALRQLEVTTPQYAALSALDASGPLSGAELARRSFVTPQTMNAILVNLEQAGLVERRPHAEHGRVLETHLDPRGRALVRRAHTAVEAVEAQMLTGLTRTERERLAGALRRCADNLALATQA